MHLCEYQMLRRHPGWWQSVRTTASRVVRFQRRRLLRRRPTSALSLSLSLFIAVPR
jgi:hypothetical protein